MRQNSILKRILKKPVFSILLLIISTVVVYSNSLQCQFIFDDHPYITEDRAIRVLDPSPHNFIQAALNGKPENRIIPNLSFAVNYYLGKYEVEGYHILNIAIHLFSGLFLFLFFRTTLRIYSRDQKSAFGSSGYSNIFFVTFAAACLWLLHPAQSQAVTYIVQRMTSIMVLFYILSLLLYTRGRENWQANRRAWAITLFVGCIGSGVCAFLSKENAATLPITILLYEWFFFQNARTDWSKRYLLWAAAALVLFGIMAAAYLGENPLHRISAAYDRRDFTLLQRGLTEFRVVIYYISLFFFPHPARLKLDYDYPISNGLMQPPTTLISAAAICALFAFAVYLAFRKRRLAAFCIFWFFITLAIESSIIGIEIIYEHRLYHSMMLPVLLCVVCLARRMQQKRVITAVTCTVLLISGTWTYSRNSVWVDPLTFWQDNHLKEPYDPRVFTNLGRAWLLAGDVDRAIACSQKSILIQSKSEIVRKTLLDPMTNLGIALIQKGEYRRAADVLQNAIEIDPFSYGAQYHLGSAFLNLGNAGKAIAHFEAASRIQPDSPKALTGLGGAWFKYGDSTKAIQILNQALSIDPESIEAHLKIGQVLLARNQVDSSIPHFRAAGALAPGNEDPELYMGMACAKQGRFAEAIRHYEQALRLNPDRLEISFQLAVVHAFLEDYDAAIAVFKQMLSEAPTNHKIYYNIGCMYALQNRAEDAVYWLKQAIRYGYDNLPRLRSDPDLKNIRNSEVYQNFIVTLGKM